MSSSEKKSRLSLITLVIILSMAFFAIYYVSTDTYRQRVEWRRERMTTINEERQKQQKSTDRVVLQRGERQRLDRTALVYMGIEDEELIIDLYLLDLDPQQGYIKRIDMDAAEEGFDLGRITYRLLSANSSYLVLKVVKTTATP